MAFLRGVPSASAANTLRLARRRSARIDPKAEICVLAKVMRALIALLLLAPTALPAPAAGFPVCRYGKPTSGCVYDGDTSWLDNEKIRTLGYDAPEMGWPFCKKAASGAKAARDRLRQLLNTGNWSFERQGFDKYDRTLAWVTIGGEPLARIMIREGHGRPWIEGGPHWC